MKFSTNRLVTIEKPDIFSDSQSLLFLSNSENRQGEGGLRTQGYYKKSYNDKPLISIITVVYNGEQFLEETIKSVLNQTYDNVEYIIIDGGSTDGTLEIIRKYENAIDYWISEKDDGIYDAWNKGIKVSHGEWIAFLGADDQYLLNAIENYIDFLKDYSNIDYISSLGEVINEYYQTIKIIGQSWKWKEFKAQMKIVHVGSLHHKNLFVKYGLYDYKYKVAGDYEFLLRARSNLRTLFYPHVTVKIMHGGVSQKYVKVAYQEALQAKCKTAKRMKIVCYFEYLVDIIKIFIIKKIKGR